MVVTVEAGSDNDIVHVGCYAKNLVDTQESYYKIKGSLTWERGVGACNHRYTTYMGVQADDR